MDVQLHFEDEGTVALAFEHLEPKQGFICDLLHTGTHNDLTFSGVLVSAKQPQRQPLPSSTMSDRMAVLVLGLGILIPLGLTDVLTKMAATLSPLSQMIIVLGSIPAIILWIFILVGFALKRGLTKIDFGKPYH